MADLDSYKRMKPSYKAVINQEWKESVSLHMDTRNEKNIVLPMTMTGDTAIHMAVQSGGEEPIKELLWAISDSKDGKEVVIPRNTSGNTPLHEAASVGNLAAAKLLVEFNKNDLLIQNTHGETPLFRAARCGNLEIVRYFLDECDDIYTRSKLNWIMELLTDDFNREEYVRGTPIIHAAIRNSNFEVVLKLVDFDKSLLELKDLDGNTALHLLANMPLAFKSGTPLNWFTSRLYDLLPDEDIYKYKFSNFGSLDNDEPEFISNTRQNSPEDLELGRKPDPPPRKLLNPNCQPPPRQLSGKDKLENITNMVQNIQNNDEDLEAGPKPNLPLPPRTACNPNRWQYFKSCFLCLLWKIVIEGWPAVKELYETKKRHKLALIITEMLAEIDSSWLKSRTAKKPIHDNIYKIDMTLKVLDDTLAGDSQTTMPLPSTTQPTPSTTQPTPSTVKVPDDTLAGDSQTSLPLPSTTQPTPSTTQPTPSTGIENMEYDDHHETPLLLAASNGIIEIVEKIIEAYPQAVDFNTSKRRNLLHIVIAHRQSDMFDWLEKKKFIMSRLATRIDDLKFTVLHHVGIIKFYRGGTQHGPALQLQEELNWFQRVERVIPSLYKTHHSKTNLTAQELFNQTHVKMHEDAKEWLKKTSESCSAVAVLVATVVFAAAYTMPGGLNGKTGSPVLLKEPIFLTFTIMDIVALATSLSSVVLFLSILTSSFKMEDFMQTLPLKLSCGFQLLFFSIATTMLTFSLTIILTLKSNSKLMVTLLYMATLFPVTIFLLIQFPLYLELITTIWSLRNKILRFLPTGCKVPTTKFHRK